MASTRMSTGSAAHSSTDVLALMYVRPTKPNA